MADELITLDNLKRYHSNLLDKIPANQIWHGSGTPPTNTDHILAINYTNGLVYYKNELGGWNTLSVGSGGSTNNAEFTVTNKSGWLAKTVALGAECDIIIEWSSIEDEIPTGNGTVIISVDDTVKSIYEVQQGEITINIDNYLVLGKNNIVVSISDLYGNKRDINFTISCVKVTLNSDFNSSVAYTGDIKYLYTPTGDIEKTVHFVVDGEEIDHKIVYVSGREQDFTIPSQSHGNHTFEVYFTGEIDGQPVESNHLYYDLICYEEGNNTPIIACNFTVESVKQYATVDISYIVYTPLILYSEVTISDNFGYSTTRTVDRTPQPFPYKAENVGVTEITFAVGDTKRVISFETVENQINVYAETSNLELYLSSKGRSNNDKETNPLDWSFDDVKAELTNFNLTNDGWQLDSNNNAVLRVTGDSRVYIPFNIFENDFRTNGKTIEFEFATRDVLNYDAVIMSCMSGGRGIEITAQKALLSFEGGEIFTQYKEDEHIRVAFVVDRRNANNENPLVRIYINGVMSGAIKYSADTDFSQFNPVGISIGSNECTTDIYCIRVYGNNLSQYQILDNWIADTQDIEELIKRYDRNNIFDAYGNVTVDKLPTTLPYLILEAENYKYLPQYKGDKERPINGRYVDPMWQSRCFTFYQAQIDVQGTSSQYYSRKNYKIKFKNGFIIDGVTQAKYQLRETSMPTNVFTFKADVASSEGANNVELCKLYDEICPVKTPPQKVDNRVRQGIEGYPILVFYYDGNNYYFLGKYNFNNDKGTPEVFGFAEGDESWEILQNNTDMVIWKDDDFSTDAWKKSFEARYPEDNINTTNLNVFATWLKSTDTEAVDTDDEKAERIAKFRNELGNYANVDMLIFNYIFTELFLMVDNRAKNAFPTRYDKDGKWLILPYDYDTAIGINNEGELKYGYELEDTDLINGNFVFNGQDSVLYVNLRLAFADEIMDMYKTLRSQKKLSYEEVEKRFEDHQNVWGEAIFNEDARFKYIEPLIEEGNSTYLPMLQGSKASQRKWWLYNRFRYIDSKYNAGDSLSDYIMLRGYGVSDIYIKPYADIYATVAFDSVLVQCRALRKGTPENGYKIETPLSAGNGAVISIYSASQLADIGDLSGLKVGMADFSKGTKLSKLKVGDGAEGYENPNLADLTIGNLTLLTELDVRNCSNLAQTVDVSGCTNLEHAYFEGTKITGVTLPNGGILKTLHLPSTVTNLTIRNQPLLTDFEMPSYENLTTLRLENLDVDLFDTKSMILQMPENSRVRVLGVEWTIDTAEGIFEVFNKLDKYRGLDEYGNNVDKPQISGVIHTGTITSNDYAEMIRRYPNFTIDYEHITSNVYFYVEGAWVHTSIVYDGADCPNPIGEFIDTPTKAETEKTKFVYAGWDNDLKNVTADRTVNATFDAYTKCVVTFINGNVEHSKTTYITGDNIVIPSNPIKESTAQYEFEFKGWSLDGSNVVDVAESVADEDITYYAVYDSILRYYTITFLDYDGKVLQSSLVAYGTIPFCESPTREETAQYFYDFDGWDKEVSVVTSDTTYMATYLATLRTYTVTWVDEDGSRLLESDVNVPYGTMPSYDGATPTKQGNAQYTYTFKGWHIEKSVVTGDITYIATYTETVNKYTVLWKNEDGTILETDTTEYGKIPTYDRENPTKASTAQYDFVFAGWDTAISEVTKDVVYTATYDSLIRSYAIKFVNYDGALLKTQSVEYGSMPTAPTPTREGYDFTGWDKTVVAVTGEATYTAQYKIKTYTIKFVDYNGTVLSEQTVNHGSMPTTPANPSRTGHTFTGWDSTVVTATANKTYTAQYEIQKFTITFKAWGGEVIRTDKNVPYGSSLTPPTPTREGYTFIGWSPEISDVTGDMTYNAIVTKSVTTTISARPTKVGANQDMSYESFLAGTGELKYATYGKIGHAIVYGFNFEELRGKSGVQITNMSVKFIGGSYSGSSPQVQFIKDFNTSGTNYSAYTDLGDGQKSVSVYAGSTSGYKEVTLTSADIPKTVAWVKSNVNSFINGYTSNSFGIYCVTGRSWLKDITISIDCSYTETVIG